MRPFVFHLHKWTFMHEIALVHTNFHIQVSMIDVGWPSIRKPAKIHQFGCRVCVMVRYRRPALKLLRCSLGYSISGRNQCISTRSIAQHMHAHMSAGCKKYRLVPRAQVSIHYCFPKTFKSLFFFSSSLMLSTLPPLLCSILDFLCFYLCSFLLQYYFSERKINKLLFSAVRKQLRK